MRVYLLQHEHDLDDDATDVKTIGVYGSEAEAVAARARVVSAPGFRDHPEGFSIDAYEVGEDHWREGFVSAEPQALTADRGHRAA